MDFCKNLQKCSKSLKIATLAVRHYARSNRNEKLTLDKSSKYYFDSKDTILQRFLTSFDYFFESRPKKCSKPIKIASAEFCRLQRSCRECQTVQFFLNIRSCCLLKTRGMKKIRVLRSILGTIGTGSRTIGGIIGILFFFF